MELHRLAGRCGGGYTTFGGVWNKGEVTENRFRLLDGKGENIEVQSAIAAYWPDGSIKWSSHTADSDKMGDKVTLEPYTDEKAGNLPKGAGNLSIQKTEESYAVNTGMLALEIPLPGKMPGKYLAIDVKREGVLLARKVYPVFQLERKMRESESLLCTHTEEFCGEITKVEAEQEGPLQAVFRFEGNHISGRDIKMPFVIRMYLWSGSPEIRFVHTFFYDGKEERDYMKGMGIRLDASLSGKAYNRHIRFAMDGPAFSEAAVQLYSRIPKIEEETFRRQQSGIMEAYDGQAGVAEAMGELPVWNRYSLCQDSSRHFRIRKQTKEECCMLSCRQGNRAPGVMAVNGENGGLMLGIRDFWQKCPAGLEVSGLAGEESSCTAWFFSPEAEAYDFRHYSTESYPRTCYEGFDEIGASAYGIAVTSQCQVMFVRKIPLEDELDSYARRMQKPCVYVGTPEYYHDRKAFGYWSLPKTDTDSGRWYEEQMEKAFAFYRHEIENRDWYGLFDYGDVMHTYDPVRHVWRYDIGGFAWQNTELVPTYWLWLYFLRTGREDVFTVAEAMTRHCSEVDIYHFGENRGMGSRHNVRHWGCSCKEPRISMAGHQRFLCYLTGDLRLGDVMDEVREADYTMVKNIHTHVKMPDGTTVPGIRSGPDWSSFVSNWMTAYERTLDERYLERIRTGIGDIADTPYGFASGPDFCYDVENAHLIYRGEMENTPNQHLQICMGGVQVWLETAMMMEDDTLNRLLADLGAFYLLSPEEKSRITKGKIKKRPFSWPAFATSVTAYSAMRNQDAELAGKTWKILDEEICNGHRKGYEPVSYGREEQKYQEIPWITTNRTAQWCLNCIMCLEFIPEYLP